MILQSLKTNCCIVLTANGKSFGCIFAKIIQKCFTKSKKGLRKDFAYRKTKTCCTLPTPILDCANFTSRKEKSRLLLTSTKGSFSFRSTEFKSTRKTQTSFTSLNPATRSQWKDLRSISGSTILLAESSNSTKRQRSWVWLQRGFTFPTESFSANTKTKRSWWLLRATETDWSGFTWVEKRKGKKRQLWTNFSFTLTIWKSEKTARSWSAQLDSDRNTLNKRSNRLMIAAITPGFQLIRQWNTKSSEGWLPNWPKIKTRRIKCFTWFGRATSISLVHQHSSWKKAICTCQLTSAKEFCWFIKYDKSLNQGIFRNDLSPVKRPFTFSSSVIAFSFWNSLLDEMFS